MKKFMNAKFNIHNIQPYYIYMTKNCQTPVIDRKSYSLGINENGHAKLTFLDGTVIESNPGDIVFCPIGSSYDIEVYEPYDSYNISFYLTNEVKLNPFVFNAKNDPKLIENFKKTFSIWRTQKFGYEERTFSELYQIIYTMKNYYIAEYLPTKKHNIIKPAVEYIHKNFFTQNISIDHLAELCQTTHQYFGTIFKQIYGISPLKYINNLQMNYAKQLIDSNAYTIGEISTMLGFSELSQFSRKFKKITGYSPSEYKINKL